MVQVLKGVKNEGVEYWSRADAFLLPLTGLKKINDFDMKSYLFWEGYSIENYNLILSFDSSNYEDFIMHCRENIFPVLDKGNYLVENYDCGSRSVFVLDMSEWSMDIEQFVHGKYSKFSGQAKKTIYDFHYEGGEIELYIYGALYPKATPPILKGQSIIEHIADEYGFGEEFVKIGEACGIFDREKENLTNLVCKDDRIVETA